MVQCQNIWYLISLIWQLILLEQSKKVWKSQSLPSVRSLHLPVKEEKVAEPDPIEEDDIDDIDTPVEDTIEETTETSTYPDDLDAVIRKMYKECKDAELKVSVKNVIAEYGKLNDVDEDGLKRIYDMMN